MKKLLLLLASFALIASTYAGPPEFSEAAPESVNEQLFLTNELQVDLFTALNVDTDEYSTGAGVTQFLYSINGIGIGIGGDVTFTEGGEWSSGASIVARKPLEEYGAAPFVYGGGGWVDTQTFDIDNIGWHVGGGIDIRVQSLPIMFVDYRYSFLANDTEDQSLRVGVRYLF